MPFGITDPNQLVALGQEGTGAAQIFDSSQPTEQLGSLFERLNKEKQQARLDKQKSEQAKLAKLDKIAPVYGGWDADVPWFKKNFDAWKEIAVVDPDSPQAMGAYNDLIAASVMQEDQKKQALDYKDYLVKNKEKLTPEQFDAGTQWLENYRAAGNPIERANIPPPEYYDVEEEQVNYLERFTELARETPRTYEDIRKTGEKEIKYKVAPEKALKDSFDVMMSEKGAKDWAIQTYGSEKEAFAAFKRKHQAEIKPYTKSDGRLNFWFGDGQGGVQGKFSYLVQDVTPEESLTPSAPYISGTKQVKFTSAGKSGTASGLPAIDLTIGGGTKRFIPETAQQNPDGSITVTGFTDFPSKKGDYDGYEGGENFVEDVIIIDNPNQKQKFEVTYFGGKTFDELFGTTSNKKKIEGF